MQGNGGQPAEPLEAVVIVDHGSRRAESNEMLHEFADLYRCVQLSKVITWLAAHS